MCCDQSRQPWVIQFTEQLQLVVELVEVVGGGQHGLLGRDALAAQPRLVHRALRPFGDGGEEGEGGGREVERDGGAPAAPAHAPVGLLRRHLHPHLPRRRRRRRRYPTGGVTARPPLEPRDAGSHRAHRRRFVRPLPTTQVYLEGRRVVADFFFIWGGSAKP